MSFPTISRTRGYGVPRATSDNDRVTSTPSRNAQSELWFERALTVSPGGVNSPVRAFRAVGGTPRFMVRGEGAWLTDADGERYVDLVGSWGPMLLGHAHPDVVAAVQDAVDRGTSFGTPSIPEVELAEEIVSRTPVEQVRLVSSGTEATMSALRLARGFTGRDLVVKFAGCYHGHVDSLLAEAGSGVVTLGLPETPGVPVQVTAGTVVLRSPRSASASPASSPKPRPGTWASYRRSPGSTSSCPGCAASTAPCS